MPTASINGISLYYEDQGRREGEPLLLIMGLGGHSLAWFLQLPALTPHYRVLTFDNRGVGRSEVPPGPYTLRQMADDAAGLLDHLGVARAHVVGWSMGGLIAQELALSYPERVGRLVLLASAARPRPALVEPWLTFQEQALTRELDRRGFALWLMPWGFTPAFMTQPDRVELALAQALADPYPATPQGFAAQAAACRAVDLRERLPALGTPTLVLVGAEDILTPPAYSRELAERIPGARLQVLERGGHGMPLEYPQAVNEALLAFLAGPDAAAPGP